jgi:hypothetical protein
MQEELSKKCVAFFAGIKKENLGLPRFSFLE